jgi:hypothetical protein
MAMTDKLTIRIDSTPERDEEWDEMVEWCVNHFGAPAHRFMTVATENYMDFIFEDKQDAVLFTLRWV